MFVCGLFEERDFRYYNFPSNFDWKLFSGEAVLLMENVLRFRGEHQQFMNEAGLPTARARAAVVHATSKVIANSRNSQVLNHFAVCPTLQISPLDEANRKILKKSLPNFGIPSMEFSYHATPCAGNTGRHPLFSGHAFYNPSRPRKLA